MTVAMDTLAFVERFETAGFAGDQARALASAFGAAHDITADTLVTKDHLDLRLAEMEARLTKQMAEMDVRWTRQIAENGRDISARLWSTIAIIAGVSTAISATIGAGITVLLHLRGM